MAGLVGKLMSVCVLLLQDLLQSCSRGGRRRVEDMCYERLCDFVTVEFVVT
jgi:hypothetical protein